MSTDHPTTQDYLAELIQYTQGNPQTSVSMYEVGAKLGLDKTRIMNLTIGYKCFLPEPQRCPRISVFSYIYIVWVLEFSACRSEPNT